MYEYDYYTTASSTALAGGTLVMTWIFSMAFIVIAVIAMWKIFTKAGEEGWKAIIPIYNTVILFKISGLNPWMLLLLLVPIANIIITIMLYVKLAQAFGKSGGFAVGLIFLNIIFMLILAFGKAEYVGVEA